MWPLIEVSLEAKARQDQDRLRLALENLSADDPSLRVRLDRDTGQLLLGSHSEEQLDRTLAAIVQNDRLQVDIGRPRVAYRETITKAVEYTYTHKKLTGVSGQYAEVKVLFEPRERGEGFAFVDRIVGGAVPRECIASVEKGLNFQKEDGVLAGYPTVDVRATLVDGKYHDLDSNALTFELAARACFREALRLAGPIILEPVMRVEVVTPEVSLADVIVDIKRRRGQLIRLLERGSAMAVEATVPLSEMIGYANALRNMSHGRASFSMHYDRYEAVPAVEPPPDNFPPAMGMRAG